MAFELLCGPANSGKVRAVVERVLEGCRTWGGAWFVVPTAGDLSRARRELAIHAGGLALGARVGTFHHLVREQAGDVQVEATDVATEVVLVRRLLEGQRSFRGALEYPGFVATARRTLIELRAAEAVGESTLGERLAQLPAGQQRAWCELLDGYGAALAAIGQHDEAWFERRALRRIVQGDVRGLVPIHAYGFDDLDHLQVRLLEAASAHVPVSMSLPFVRGRMVFARRQGLVDRLQAIGARVEDRGEPAVRSAALRALESRFYEPTCEPIAGDDGDVRFVECCGELQQAEELVREVGGLLQSGVPPGEIACLTANPVPGRTMIEAAFRRAGVPVTFEMARRVNDTPAGRALLHVIDAIIDGDVTALLAFARSRVSPVERFEVDTWQRASLQQRLAAAPGREGRLGAWRDAHWLPASVRELVRIATDLRDLRVVARVRALVDDLRPASPGDIRLLAAIDQQLERLADACGAKPPNLIELRDAIATMPIPAPSQREPDAVVVASVTRVRTDRFEAVVVYDLHSGGFNASATDEHSAPLVARELAYIAFTRAWSRVSFVRQAAGSDGRVRAAHPVWLELRRLLQDAPVIRRGLDAVVCEPEDSRFEGELGRAAALAIGEGTRQLDPLDALALSLLPTTPAARASDAGEAFRASFAADPRLRVTDVESYVGCPSRWFIQRHLLPRDPAGPNSRQIIGMLVHEALAVLVPQLVGDRPAKPARGLAEAAMAGAVDALPRGVVVRATDRAIAGSIVERFVRDERVYGTRSLSEVSFGSDGDTIPSLVVGGVALTGRVDRMDVDEAGRVVVHDYKLSRTATAGAKLVEAGRLQIPLYWHALRKAEGLTPVAALYRPLEAQRPRGMIDNELGPDIDGQFATDRFDGESLDALLDEVMAEAEHAVAGIRAGVVVPEPRGGTCDSWCDLQSICRVEGR